jgi:hypothetical protein
MERDFERLFHLVRRINNPLGAKEKRLVPPSTQMSQSVETEDHETYDYVNDLSLWQSFSRSARNVCAFA